MKIYLKSIIPIATILLSFCAHTQEKTDNLSHENNVRTPVFFDFENVSGEKIAKGDFFIEADDSFSFLLRYAAAKSSDRNKLIALLSGVVLNHQESREIQEIPTIVDLMVCKKFVGICVELINERFTAVGLEGAGAISLEDKNLYYKRRITLKKLERGAYVVSAKIKPDHRFEFAVVKLSVSPLPRPY